MYWIHIYFHLVMRLYKLSGCPVCVWNKISSPSNPWKLIPLIKIKILTIIIHFYRRLSKYSRTPYKHSIGKTVEFNSILFCWRKYCLKELCCKVKTREWYKENGEGPKNDMTPCEQVFWQEWEVNRLNICIYKFMYTLVNI